MDVWITSANTADGKTQISIALAYGKRDRFLRRVVKTVRLASGETITRTETLHDVRLNEKFPASYFVFNPPAGAVEEALITPPGLIPNPNATESSARVARQQARRYDAMQQPPLGTNSASQSPPPVTPQFRAARPPKKQKTGSNSLPAPTPRRGEPKQNTLPVQANPPPAASSPLAVVAEPGVKADGGYPARATHAFGRVSLLDSPVVEKVFTLKNVSRKTVTVGRVQGSCGCLSVVVAPKAAGAGAKPPAAGGSGLATLEPGETAAVRTSVNLEVLYAGDLSKTVYVYTEDDAASPAVRIDLVGTLAPAVTFDPPVLSFGSVPAGTPKTLVLTVRPDARLVAVAGPPALLPTVPGVRSTLLPADNKDGVTPPTAQSPKQGEWRYEVTLGGTGVPLGTLNGYLSFAPETAGDGGDANAARAWRSARVPVVAGIVGDVSASPPSLAFGLVSLKPAATAGTVKDSPAQGDGSVPLATVAARLIPAKAGSLAGATARCDNPFVSAEVVRAKNPDGGGGETDSLSVTLRRGIEPGALQTRVTLRLANGQELIIPVTAYVQP